MPLMGRTLIVSIAVAAACTSSVSAEWKGESRNTDEQLSPRQRSAFRLKLGILQRSVPNFASAARKLALLVSDGKPGETDERRVAGTELAAMLEILLRDDPEMRSLGFISSDFVKLLSVSATDGQIADFETVEPDLREQGGFFPEDPQTPIEDLDSYPRQQFAVDTRGATGLRIRMPVVSEGYYLGDLVAEYELRR